MATLVAHRLPAEGPRKPVSAERPPPRKHADLIVIGKIVTMNPGQPEVEALAASHGRIVALGSAGDLDGLRGPGTEVVELGERVAYPGFVEPHMHIWSTATFENWVDCSPLTLDSFDAVLDALRQAAATVGEKGWVLGKLFDPVLFPGEPELTRDLLDQIVPDHPAMVMNASMHFAYANSKALDVAHITEETPNPPGGIFGRTNGRLNGSVGEIPALMTFLSVVPQLSHDDFLDAIVTVLRRARDNGVTKIHEAGTGALWGVAELDMLHGLSAEGRLPVRVTTAQIDSARAALESAGLQPNAGDDTVRAVSWKVVADGSNQGRSGYMTVPYLGRADRGQPNYTAEQLVEIISRAHAEGWQIMVHANGDASIEQVVGAYETALSNVSPHDRRHRVEHCSLPTEDHLERMAALGVSPSFLMNHVYYWGRAFQDLLIGSERAAGLDPVATARKQKLPVSFHSDHSVTPINPLRSVQTAVTRAMRDGGESLNPAECDTVDAAMRAITIDAAWQTHTDNVIGSIELGKYADLVFLSEDPQSVAPESIADIDVTETCLAGVLAETSAAAR
jgi:predicted amidohydrolase YtcJ